MRYLLFILLFSFIFITKGQVAADSSETVMLEVQVFDEDSVTPINNAGIKIIGIDGSSNSYTADSLGFIAIKLKSDLTYSIIASKNNYLNGKNKLSTKENLNKKNYSLQFYLEKIKTIGCSFFPKFNFLENQLDREYKNYEEDDFDVVVDVLEENPNIVLELTAVKSKNEPEKISKKRAEKIIKELVAQGIEKDRLVFKDGGIGEKEEDNRYVVFKVLKTDYVSKKMKK